jgi:hypothetical protein
MSVALAAQSNGGVHPTADTQAVKYPQPLGAARDGRALSPVKPFSRLNFFQLSAGRARLNHRPEHLKSRVASGLEDEF